MILRVTKIEPEGVTPFAEAKDKIKQDLALERAKRDLTDLQTKVEDDRAGGATLKEIAQKYGLAATEIAAIDAQGRDAAGQPYALPQQQKLTQAVFSSEVGADTDMIDGHDAGVVWYSLDGVTPARDRTLDEARGDVVAAWTTEEKAKRLKAKADEVVKALDLGKTIDDEAKALGVEAKQAWNLKRNGDGQGLDAAAVNLVFATPVKGHATALSGSGADRIVFEVTDSTVPPFDPAAPQSQQIAAQLGQLVAQDLLAEYIGRLQNDLGTSINPANLNRAIGAGTEG